MGEGYDVHLSLDDFNQFEIKQFQKVGLSLYNGKGYPAIYKNVVDGELLGDFAEGQNVVIDAESIKKIWFPQYDGYFDVFISHSHDDITLALTLAGYLKQKFGLRSFIDSYLWGYVDELQSVIDNRVCNKTADGNYIVSERNKTTAHVHMMLLTSLVQAMNGTRCLFFLNTNKSTSLMGGELKTYSPWIHGELFMYHIMRKNADCKLFSLMESVAIVQDADTKDLKKMTIKTFEKWAWQYNTLKLMKNGDNIDSLSLLESNEFLFNN